jgi:hypothetical protein
MILCSAHLASPRRLLGNPQRFVLNAVLRQPEPLVVVWQEQSFEPPLHHAIDPDVSTMTKKYGLTC